MAQIEPSLFSYNSLCAKRLRCISFRFSRVSRMGFTSRSFVRMGNRKTSRMYKYWPQTFLNCLYVCDSPFPSPYLHLFWFILSKTMSSCTFIKNSLSVMLQWQEEHASIGVRKRFPNLSRPFFRDMRRVHDNAERLPSAVLFLCSP